MIRKKKSCRRLLQEETFDILLFVKIQICSVPQKKNDFVFCNDYLIRDKSFTL
jgi:hypothetical protein